MIITLFCKTITTRNSGYSTWTGVRSAGCAWSSIPTYSLVVGIHPETLQIFFDTLSNNFYWTAKIKQKKIGWSKNILWKGVRQNYMYFSTTSQIFFWTASKKNVWCSILLFFFFFLDHHFKFFLFIAMVILSASVKTFSVYRILDFQYVPGK